MLEIQLRSWKEQMKKIMNTIKIIMRLPPVIVGLAFYFIVMYFRFGIKPWDDDWDDP